MSRWIRIASPADARDDEPVGVSADGRDFALCKVGGELFVIDDWCTHGKARLSEGYLLDHCIECPFHQGQFDVRTGEALCLPATDPIRTYPVRIDGDDVLVDVD